MERVVGPFNYRYYHRQKENGEEKQGFGKTKNKQRRNRVGRRELEGIAIMVRMGNANTLL